ncbi:MAG: class I SAM-dependent methyltransferase [Lachnospiraceae bacterium]
MLNNLMKHLAKPELYTKTEGAFWDDEHISAQMLKAHLDPDFEGATRKTEFIEKSAKWINEILSPLQYPQLLDIGCGPGIYAERFAQSGYQVTGIDFSQRSITHAQQSALQQTLNITYLYQNYLNMDLNQAFDCAVMIYCDYGALSQSDRKTLMDIIYRHLKPGGKILLDVFSVAWYKNFQEQQTWQLCHQGGFWHKNQYLALQATHKYPNNITLEQTTIITEDQEKTYYLWNTCYKKETLLTEAEAAGFKLCNIYGDLAGANYNVHSPTIAILLEK